MAPFPRQDRVAERLREAMVNCGVLSYLSAGLVGRDGKAIIFRPPFIIGQSEIDLAVDTFATTPEGVLGKRREWKAQGPGARRPRVGLLNMLYQK